MTDADQIITRLNEHAPTFIKLLGGKVVAIQMDRPEAVFEFHVPLDYCHSGDVVQGGFVTAMLDAAMSHAVFGTDQSISGVATLEITTRFEGVTRGDQPLTVTGRVRKKTHRIAFLEADIQTSSGEVIVTAQSVAKLSRTASQ